MANITTISRNRRTRLRILQSDCENSSPNEQADLLREAQPLFAEVTKEMGLPAPPLKSNENLEALLADGAFETAALQLLNKGSAFVVSQGQAGVCFASVALPGDSEEKSAVGDTVALSLIAAEASAMLTATN